jgi:hypothetical protein
MKRIIFLLMSFLLTATLMITAKPKMVFECGAFYDWGTVKHKDSPLKADIKIYNKGEDTLDIKRVKPMCGCTTAPLSKKIIPPGDSALLKVTLNIEQYEGAVLKRITFTTNEVDPETYLEIKANVYLPIKLFPSRYLNFSRMFLNNESMSKLIINNISGHDINVTNIVIKPEEMKVNLKAGDIIPKDSDYVIEAKVTPLTLGQFNCRLDISFNDQDQPNIIISGWGTVAPESEKNVDYSKENDSLNQKDNQGKDQNPAGPATINPTKQQYQIQPGSGIKIENNPNLPVVPLVPDKNAKIEAPVNKVPIKAEPVEKIELGKPMEMPPPIEEPKKEKK